MRLPAQSSFSAAQAARPGPETKLIVCRYEKMDLSSGSCCRKRRRRGAPCALAVSTPSGTRILPAPISRYETYVEEPALTDSC
jgi:hypothetical protein